MILYDFFKKLTTEWIIAIISVITALSTLLVAYVTWRTDKGSLNNKIKTVNTKVDNLRVDFEDHLEDNEKKFEKIHKENREDHKLLFEKMDEIKNFLITGKFKKND